MVGLFFGLGALGFVGIWLVPLAVVVWGIVDAATRPEWAWQRAGQSKVLWIVLQAVGVFLCWIGLVLAIVYLAAIRPKVQAAQGGGPAAAGYGGYGGYGTPPPGPAPGWYPDPSGSGRQRYWDGQRWTDAIG